MRYTKLGQSDLSVSRICLGCMGFGDAGNGQHSWTIDEAHSREIIKRAMELGVNFLDTAIAYQSGTSEQYVGRAVRDFAKRENVVVATKFLPRTEDEIAAGITGQQHIERMLNTSLSNLGLDYGDFPGMASDQSDGPGGRRNKAPPYRRSGQSGGSGPDSGRTGLSGGTLCSPRSGGRDGAEHRLRR